MDGEQSFEHFKCSTSASIYGDVDTQIAIVCKQLRNVGIKHETITGVDG
jgi:hypothetical protein